jgi:uncharacterized spore protein YtfJ
VDADEPSTEEKSMSLPQLVSTVRHSLSVTRVLGEPYERDGVTVIPAASVRGGAGGGTGKKDQTGEEGEGGGFGMIARPAGAFVVRDGTVTWHPAVDVNRIVTAGVLGGVAAAWLLGRRLGRRSR